MADYTESLGLELITPGTQAGLWGTTTNNNLTNVDQAISGITPISFAGLGGTTRTLTSNNGAADEARSAVLNITGTATAGNTIIIPNKQKLYVVRNDTGQSITFKTLTGTVTYVVQAGYYTMVFCNGNDEVYTGLLVPGATTLGVTGGGTGVTTFGAGGILRSAGGTANLFAFPTVSLNTEVAGTLPVGNGGTGNTSFTSGALLTGGGGGSNLGSVVPGTAKYALVSTGSAWNSEPIVNAIAGGTGISITGSGGSYTISATGSSSGTVTSVSGTGSVNGITLSGTVTSAGALTLGGTLSGTASGLTVGTATNATYATSAGSATYATSAGSATTASSATTAGSATNATNAINLNGSGTISNTTTSIGVTTTSTTNPAPGIVGEVLTFSGSGALTNGGIATLGSGTITAGDWDITGVWTYVSGSGTTSSYATFGLNTVPATIGGSTGGPMTIPSGVRTTVAASSGPLRLTSSTTYYFNMYSTFAGGTATGEYTIYARRVR